MSNPSITADKTPWYQWDTGLTVTVSGGEMNECHFANRKQGTAYVQAVINGVARVPDELLQVAAPIKAYGYVSDGAGGQTYVEETFEVIARNIPADYTYTKTAQKTIRDAEVARDEAVQAAKDAKGSELAADDSAVEASTSAQSAGESASAAATSASNAAKSAGEAAKSASDAKAAAGKAVEDASKLLKTYTDNAKTSADNAATSASNAAASATAAANSASDAAASEANAALSASSAENSAEYATAKKVAAENAAQVATSAADAATTAADRADKAADKAIQAVYHHFPVWDEEAGEFSVESIKAWLAWNSDGKQYGVVQTLDAVQRCTKTLANAGMENPVPSTLAVPGSDPYWQRGPFRWEHVNATVDDDGTPHITGMKSFGNFSYNDGRDVFALTPVRYVSYGFANGGYQTVNSDTPHVGLVPEERSTLPDGTLAPYMLRAAFPAGLVDGKPVSRPGVRLWNRTCSHNSMNEKAKLKGKAYSGMTGADMDYLYDMFLLKYANKSSQSVFAGCTGHYEQVAVTVASESSASVVIAKATADKWPVGCAVMVGTTTTANSDRGNATSYDLADQANVLRKEAVGESDVRLVLDCDPFTSAVGQIVSAAPWNPGATLGVQYDGSPTSCTSSREPFVLQGIECMVGAYEILGDILANGMEDGWKFFLCSDTAKSSTAVTADYASIYDFPSKDADGWSYPMAQVKSGGFYCPGDLGASTSTGTGDGVLYDKTGVMGAREFLAFGYLRNWSAAGLRFADLSVGPGWAWWSFGSRLSCDGRNGVNADEPPKAA